MYIDRNPRKVLLLLSKADRCIYTLGRYLTTLSLAANFKSRFNHPCFDLIRLANVFVNHCGLKKGDTLIVILPRIPEWWIIYIAAIRAGENLFSQLRNKFIFHYMYKKLNAI